MKAHQKTIGGCDEWLTPKWILDSLGDFDLDPCASVARPWPTACRHLTETDDGLKHEWSGRVWLNPPFNRSERPKWMRKMAEHNNGIMLIPAACETKPFREFVWGKATGVLMLSKRPHFCYTSGVSAKANSGCTICLVSYGGINRDVLIRSRLGVVLVEAGGAA